MTERLFEPGGTQLPPLDPAGIDVLEAALVGSLRRVMLLVSYDGSAFHGFAPQADPALPTVAGSLARVLSQMVRTPVSLTCAGRTDSGVHASGQVAHVDLPAVVVDRWLAAERGTSNELPRLAKSLSSQCGPALVVTRGLLAPAGFDARRSALSRRYRYEILRAWAADPLERHRTWHVPGELDLAAMRIASDGLLGEHDFAAFCRRPPTHQGPLVRRVTDVSWKSQACGAKLCIEIEANAFCHRMVRSIVGNLVAVGKGQLTAAGLREIVLSADRSRSADPAPARGLCLFEVRYPNELVEGGVLRPTGCRTGTLLDRRESRG
ncbi:MAG: tRNA pseudouridine synthase A [Acidimicrobiales bacterium]